MTGNFRKAVFFVLLLGVAVVGYQYMIKPANTHLAEVKGRVDTKFAQLAKFQQASAAAEDLAKQLGYEMVIHPADWKRYGRGAGFVRNTDIATGSDYLIACVAPDRKGGTEDTVRKFCKKLGLTEEEAIVTGWLVLVS